MKKLFATDPHESQILIEAKGEEVANAGYKLEDRLFTLMENDCTKEPDCQVTMTGEEIESFCKQWRLYANANGTEL